MSAFGELLSRWEGVWRGQGRVVKGDDVLLTYQEVLTLTLVRTTPETSVLQFQQRTHSSGRPFHAETGLVRISAEGDEDDDHYVEAGFTHESSEEEDTPFPSGIVAEMGTGNFDGEKLIISSEDFLRPERDEDDESSKKVVTKYHREYHLVFSKDTNSIQYTQYLHDQPHVHGELFEDSKHGIV
mmetsp:Transcript_11256/g.26077  ORF Transcript_11256/g.26077 Transcript_11256/m.26077 type:complete len:184 (-) Transcript_11256:68-619(-)